MKALIWKEWKENARWALLGGLALALACAWMLHQALLTNNWELVWSQGLMPFTLLAPVIGAAFGFLQIIPELRRDQWAFLVHRPVSRGTIFFGKVVAGLSLYILAVTLPLLGVALWLRVPGHLPGPFIGQLFLPAIADICGGAVFYFAAVATALRPPHSRRHFMRALNFPAAMGCQALLVFVPYLWIALLVVAIFLAVMGVAAWGAFLSTGNFETQPKSARAATVIALYTGTALTIAALIGVIATLIPSTPGDYSYTRYEVDTLGRIVRATQGNSVTMKVTDVNGKTLKSSDGKPWAWNHFVSAASVSLGKEPEQTLEFRDPKSYAFSFSPSDPINEDTTGDTWFYVRDQGLLYGYKATRSSFVLFGYLGPDGFSAAEGALPRRFEGRLLNFSWNYQSRLLRFPNSVYWLDLGARQVQRLYEAANSQQILGATVYSDDGYGRPQTHTGAVVVEGRNIHLYSRAGTPLFVTPLEHSAADYPSLTLYGLPKHSVSIWYRHKTTEEKPAHLPIQVTEVSASGAALKHSSLPVLANPSFQGSSVSANFFAALVPPGAMAAIGVYATAGAATGQELPQYILRNMKSESAAWLAFTLVSVAAAFFCAALAWLIGKRCADGPRAQWAWTIGVFLSGFFGLLTMLMLRDWPFRETCASCDQKRVVERKACEHCGSSFAAPAPDGTEIFA